MTERLYDTASAARELGIPRGRIEDWKTRGHIAPADVIRGTSSTGLVPLYRLEELRPLAQAYLERAARRAENTKTGE